MPGPTEHKAVQYPITRYASQIGWTFILQSQAEEWRKFDLNALTPKEQARKASLFFDDILFNKVIEFNPRYELSKEELIRTLTNFPFSIQGNRDFLTMLRGEKTYFCKAENRDLNLQLIDFTEPDKNVYHITEEYTVFNGHYANREDVVFLINGIPVLVIECKNATKDEAIAIGIDQIRRYHRETPEMMLPQQLLSVTESLGFSYGVTWNLVRRNIFNWKHEEIGNLEAKVKTFCAIPQVLAFIKNYILFVEKDEELNKFILKQHQTKAVELVIDRCIAPEKRRGLVWHTQGSGKTFTIIKTAEMLYKAPQAEKPTIILLLDRNELEDQMKRNLESLGIGAVTLVTSRVHLNRLLKKDYRGIIVSMIHKFDKTDKPLNTRKNIYVLIDEAHRSTGSDLGTYLMAAIPNSSLIGFSGTPVDKTAYGKGTFKIFGIDDDKGYLHKYSIAESIKDGTTLPLFYALAPNELRVPSELLEKEFLSLAETEGISDIDELNKILQRAVQTKTFLKADQRVDAVAQYVAKHFRENVEPLGYKAFLVGVDREACALYKEALDKYLPPEYSKVVYTPAQNDSEALKRYYLTSRDEKAVRKDFANIEKLPKVLIVTEKLLTGYDAPCLYAMYLDKPMRDHTLLQAIARVNRPYEDEDKDLKKPHGFVLDFIGIFDKLEKALSFDSDEVNAVVKDIALLKNLFNEKMENEGSVYAALVNQPFTDKETDKLIEYFKDKSRRTELFKFYKQIETLYEIISPDQFLLPYIDKYKLLCDMYLIVRNAFVKRVYVDREFMRKTESLVKERVEIAGLGKPTDLFEINEHTLEEIKKNNKPDNVKIINLIKSIDKAADDEEGDLVLISMKQKAEAIQEGYEARQLTTEETLARLESLIQRTVEQKREQAEKQFDDITYFVYLLLVEKNFKNSETIARKIKHAFAYNPHWKTSENDLRELRQQVMFAIMNHDDQASDEDIIKFVETFFSYLFKAFKL
ncbi:MAG: HsdR family type I site-specific deoxyribonuclease [Nitrospirae bacterium]|nr:HsdR family type I site-specific deoxyribonuclease [Nitrospirota bacterium]